MNRIFCILIFVASSCFSFSQAELHQWYETINLGIDFNRDQSQVLIVGHDRASLWNTSDGSLIKSMPLFFDDKPIDAKNFKYIDAAPDLSEFIFQVNNSYRRFLLDIEDVDLFPDFQNHRVKQILGYDSQGWMVFFSEGFYQGFYRVRQTNNVSNLQFISMEYISKATMSNDHKFILFDRDKTFRYINVSSLEPKKAVDTKLPAESWKDEHLPESMVTLYEWNGYNKDGKEVEWRYFIELGKEPGKKIKGKQAQSYFPTYDYCEDLPYYTFGTTPNTDWILYYLEKDTDRAKATYQYALYKKDRKTCETLLRIDFCESKEANSARKQQKRDDYFTAKKEEKAKKEALKSSWYSEYISKFINLPSSYTLNYNTIAGVDVTNFSFVQNEKYRMGNPQEMAIGRICNCSNGNKVVLRVTRNQSNGMDRQSFRVFTYDNQGNEIGHQKIAETQKYNGTFPMLSYFTINSSENNWNANVTIKYPTGKERTETFSGSCN